MALLADTKRKTKFGLDPRNTNWSNDDSKFGQKLLEKMGWTKGKGLGANEDGMVDHVKASYKSDTRGLGCTPKTADAWIAHQDDFNDLLKALNAENGGETAPVKTDEKADGRKRFYGRFARGRVQTLRSTEDLDCIFGKRKSGAESPGNESSGKSDDDEDAEGSDKRHGLTTVTSSSSIQEYFAKKMAKRKAQQGSVAASDREETAGDECVKEKPESTGRDPSARQPGGSRVPAVFGAVAFSYDEGSNGQKEDCGDEGALSRNTSGVSDETSKQSRGWYDEWSTNSGKNNNSEDVTKSEKKKKKRKKKNDEGDTEPSDLAEEKSKKRKDDGDDRSVLDTFGVPKVSMDDSDSKSTKKERKKKKAKTLTETAESELSETADGLMTEKKKRKKDKEEAAVEEKSELREKKKKRKLSDGSSGQALAVEAVVEGGDVEDKVKKGRKRKSDRSSDNEMEVSADQGTDTRAGSGKKRKKKKNRKVEITEDGKSGNDENEEKCEQNCDGENNGNVGKNFQKSQSKERSVQFCLSQDDDEADSKKTKDKEPKDKSRKKRKNKKDLAVHGVSSESTDAEEALKNTNGEIVAVEAHGTETNKHCISKDDEESEGKGKRSKEDDRSEKKNKKKLKKKKKLSGVEVAVQNAFEGSNIAQIKGYAARHKKSGKR